MTQCFLRNNKSTLNKIILTVFVLALASGSVGYYAWKKKKESDAYKAEEVKNSTNQQVDSQKKWGWKSKGFLAGILSMYTVAALDLLMQQMNRTEPFKGIDERPPSMPAALLAYAFLIAWPFYFYFQEKRESSAIKENKDVTNPPQDLNNSEKDTKKFAWHWKIKTLGACICLAALSLSYNMYKSRCPKMPHPEIPEKPNFNEAFSFDNQHSEFAPAFA